MSALIDSSKATSAVPELFPIKSSETIPTGELNTTAGSNAVLKGCVVTTSGMSSKERGLVERTIIELGGLYTDNLSAVVTHLIIKRVGSAKHLAAAPRGVACVDVQWLNDCKVQGCLLNPSTYRVRAFQGLVVCVTGDSILPEERFSLQRMVEAGGGRFSKRMEGGVCTHLVAVEAKGDKYFMAKAFPGTKIVTKEWVLDSSARSEWLPEARYAVPGDAEFDADESNKSLLVKYQAHGDLQLPSKQDVSAVITTNETNSNASITTKPIIDTEAPAISESEAVLASKLSNLAAIIARKNLCASNTNSAVNRLIAPTQVPKVQLYNTMEVFDRVYDAYLSFVKSRSSSTATTITTTAKTTTTISATTTTTSTTAPSRIAPVPTTTTDPTSTTTVLPYEGRVVDVVVSDVFKNEVFYISGFSNQTRDRLLGIIFAGSGRRHLTLTNRVTRAIIGPGADYSTLDALRRHPMRIPCMKLDWLVHRLRQSCARPDTGDKHSMGTTHTTSAHSVSCGDHSSYPNAVAMEISKEISVPEADREPLTKHKPFFDIYNDPLQALAKPTTTITSSSTTSGMPYPSDMRSVAALPSHFMDSLDGTLHADTDDALSLLLDSQYVNANSITGGTTPRKWGHFGRLIGSGSVPNAMSAGKANTDSQDVEYEVDASSSVCGDDIGALCNTPSKRRRSLPSNAATITPMSNATSRTAATEIVESNSDNKPLQRNSSALNSHRYVSQFDSPAHFGLTFSQSTPPIGDSQTVEVTPRGAEVRPHFEVNKVSASRSASRRMPKMRDPNILLDEINELSKPIGAELNATNDSCTTSKGTKRPLNPFLGKSNRRSGGDTSSTASNVPQDSQVVVFDSLSQL